ncbi:MAG: AAA family ATPase [Sphingomonas sp.]|jgi:hypothetical protein|uniref:bifunctional aminoglycoside phosphotransferase/ATP-binding protein n=1 Tax=Sphingomonas sp. TaxID=28214 RepID=UPI00356B2B87
MGTAPTQNSPADSQAGIISFLATGGVLGVEWPKQIDTHAASVFLCQGRAFKLKRAVRLGYLDFSTCERRRAALEAELQFNRRTAPDLYLGLRAIRRAADGTLRIDWSGDGQGDVVDWLLEMRRFPDGALLDDLAARGPLDPALLVRLAARVFAFHAEAAVSQGSGAAAFRAVIEGNAESMAAFPAILGAGAVRQLTSALLMQWRAHAPLLDQRSRTGRVRRAHGDLHLANIAVIDGEPTLFDCLEFSAELATIDLLYDLAFLLMDLWHRGDCTGANIVLNRYLDLSAIDEAGIGLMPMFLATRAAIRSHVAAARARHAEDPAGCASMARSYLDLAMSLVAPVPARLVAVGGLSGSGKSTLARALGGGLGRAPGARILRSDVVRKRLAGVEPETRLGAEHYTPEAGSRVYATLDGLADAALGHGAAVILDATFALPREREAAERLARRTGVRFDGLWLASSESRRVKRVLGRRADASDADAGIARSQTDLAIGDLGAWRKLSAEGSVVATATAARELLGMT